MYIRRGRYFFDLRWKGVLEPQGAPTNFVSHCEGKTHFLMLCNQDTNLVDLPGSFNFFQENGKEALFPRFCEGGVIEDAEFAERYKEWKQFKTIGQWYWNMAYGHFKCWPTPIPENLKELVCPKTGPEAGYYLYQIADEIDPKCKELVLLTAIKINLHQARVMRRKVTSDPINHKRPQEWIPDPDYPVYEFVLERVLSFIASVESVRFIIWQGGKTKRLKLANMVSYSTFAQDWKVWVKKRDQPPFYLLLLHNLEDLYTLMGRYLWVYLLRGMGHYNGDHDPRIRIILERKKE